VREEKKKQPAEKLALTQQAIVQFLPAQEVKVCFFVYL
jgi:hypothetical protein